MGGLLAARVLSDFYQTVTVVERDSLPDRPENRQGVPQGRHVHLLLRRGSMILSELFPDILAELTHDGAQVWNDGNLSKIDVCFGPHQFLRSGYFTDGASTAFYGLTRPFLEYHVRRRVLALPNVKWREQRDVVDVMNDATRSRVTGVRIADRFGGTQEELDADLVVDATGRGSRTPMFLERLGFGRPAEDELVVRVSYSSQAYRIPKGLLSTLVFFRGPLPERPESVALSGCEDDIWIVTAQNRMGGKTPTDHAGMLAYSEKVVPPHITAALRRAQPVGEVARHSTRSNLWRRYDKMRRLPDGLLVIGDAICSFNPIYGQGMTVAAMDALAMRDCLRSGTNDLPLRYFGASAKEIKNAWQMSVGADLALPDIPGRQPLSLRLMNVYTGLVQTATETDLYVAEKFWRVLNLVDPPSGLMRPGVAVRVVAANLRRAMSSA